MVGSRKLSNDEVEALLGGLESDEEQAVAKQFDPNEVREFVFGSEDLSLLGDCLESPVSQATERPPNAHNIVRNTPEIIPRNMGPKHHPRNTGTGIIPRNIGPEISSQKIGTGIIS